MQDLFNQDRPLSPDLIRAGVGLLGILLGVVAIFVVLMALGTLFSGAVIPAIIQAAAGLSIPLFIYLMTRILSEILFALHRQNDRMGVLAEDVRAATSTAAKPAPAPTPEPAPVKPKAAAAKRAPAKRTTKAAPKTAAKPKTEDKKSGNS